MGSKRTWEDSSLHINVLHAIGIKGNASPIGQQVLLNFGKGTCNRLLPASCYLGRRPPPTWVLRPSWHCKARALRTGWWVDCEGQLSGRPFSKMRPREWYSSPAIPQQKCDKNELAPLKTEDSKNSDTTFLVVFSTMAEKAWVESHHRSLSHFRMKRMKYSNLRDTTQPTVGSMWFVLVNTGKWSGYGYHQPPSFYPIGPWCCLAVHGPWTWWGGRKVDKEEQLGWEGVCKI